MGDALHDPLPASETGIALPWDQTMKAEAWETDHRSGRRIPTLRFINVINFQAQRSVGRSNSVRRETIWFAPASRAAGPRGKVIGTYYLAESVADDQHNESSYRWELLAFT